MAVTLTKGAEVLALGDDLQWLNEYRYSPVAQESRYGTTGALLLHIGLRQAGRPITLGAAQQDVWVDRATGETLRQWVGLAGQQFTLDLHGRTFTVIFDHAQGAIELEAVVDYAAPIATDYYMPTLHFIEV